MTRALQFTMNSFRDELFEAMLVLEVWKLVLIQQSGASSNVSLSGQ